MKRLKKNILIKELLKEIDKDGFYNMLEKFYSQSINRDVIDEFNEWLVEKEIDLIIRG